MRKTLLLFGCCRNDRLNKVNLAFGVGELFYVVDLQAPVFIGNDVVDED